MSAEERDSIFKAYIESLDEDADKYRKDADKLTEMAEACSSPDDLIPDASGSEVSSVLWSLQRFQQPHVSCQFIRRLCHCTPMPLPRTTTGQSKHSSVHVLHS